MSQAALKTTGAHEDLGWFQLEQNEFVLRHRSFTNIHLVDVTFKGTNAVLHRSVLEKALGPLSGTAFLLVHSGKAQWKSAKATRDVQALESIERSAKHFESLVGQEVGSRVLMLFHPTTREATAQPHEWKRELNTNSFYKIHVYDGETLSYGRFNAGETALYKCNPKKNCFIMLLNGEAETARAPLSADGELFIGYQGIPVPVHLRAELLVLEF
jgi:hypothetical protein